jgi:hypothetical protein
MHGARGGWPGWLLSWFSESGTDRRIVLDRTRTAVRVQLYCLLQSVTTVHLDLLISIKGGLAFSNVLNP